MLNSLQSTIDDALKMLVELVKDSSNLIGLLGLCTRGQLQKCLRGDTFF
jgi:hypothetical protein